MISKRTDLKIEQGTNAIRERQARAINAINSARQDEQPRRGA
jgi:hypothetical protein